MSRKLDWHATWRANGTDLMLFSLLIRPLIIAPLMCLEVAGELAGKVGRRIPAAEAVWRKDQP